MKTRFAYITLSVIAALVLSSCEKNEMSRPNDFGEPNLVIKLHTNNSIVTKTAGDDIPASDSTENAIKSVKVFLVQADENGIPASDAEIVKIEDNMMKFTDGTISAKVIGLKGDYQLLYVLANCPSGLTIKTNSFDDFIGSYTNVSKSVLDEFWKISSAKSGRFFMVNGVDCNSGSKQGGILVNFSSSVSATVNLERLAAKVTAKQDRFMDFVPYHTKVLGRSDDLGYVVSDISIDSIALLNCVNSFNLIQKYDSKHTNNIVTPSSDSLNYPVSKIDKNTHEIVASSGYYFVKPDSLSFVSINDSLYCLENNPSYYPAGYIKNNGSKPDPAVSDTKMKGRVTAVVFKAKLLLADGFDAYANTPEPITVNPAVDSVIHVKSDYRIDIDTTIYKYRGQYYVDLARLQAVNPTALNGVSDPAALRAKGVKVYENGNMYYTYWISDVNRTGTYAPYYSVERNKSYSLTVKSVADFGDDLPCGGLDYDPEDPVDRAVPRIYVDLAIGPWNTKTANYEIK